MTTHADPTADALYRAILADSDDVALRHVYADRLEELGDPQAEFIRVQLRLAEMNLWDEGYNELRVRERELLLLHGTEWRRPVVGFLSREANPLFEDEDPLVRGLPEMVVVTTRTLLSRHGDLFRAAPVRSIRLIRAQPALKRILASPCLNRLDALVFEPSSLGWLGPAGAAAVAACPHLSRLSRLSLANHWIGPDGVAALFRSERLESLSDLDVQENRIGASPPEPTLPNLRRLNLSYNGLTVDSLAFLRGEWAGRLTWLDLSINDLHRGDLAAAFAASRLGPSLRSLALCYAKLRGGACAEAIVPSLTGLEDLDLFGNLLGPRGATALVALPHLAGLRRLVLHGCRCGPTGVRAVLSSPHLSRVAVLELGENRLGDRGLRALIDAPCAASLRHLCLDRNELTPAGVRRLAQAGRFPALRRLTLDVNSLDAPSIMAVAESEAFAGVVRLDLENVIERGDALCEVLASSPASARFRVLNLANNDIGPRGAAALAASPHLGGLVELTLTGNRLGRRSVEVLRERFGPRVTV